MKTTDHKNSGMGKKVGRVAAGGFLIITALAGCTKTSDMEDLTSQSGADRTSPDLNFAQINLVSDVDGFGAQRTDPALVNPWGMAVMPDGSVILGANGKGAMISYDANGRNLRDVVNIGANMMHNGGTPTGVVYNATAGFRIPATGETARFIFAGEDGRLYAYSAGDSTHVVVDRSAAGSVYKGVEIASTGGRNYLYAADFHNGAVDMFDDHFNYVGRKCVDPHMMAGFAPFNIKLISGKLFVTYAMSDDRGEDDVPGRGNGLVDIFSTDGSFLARFASQGSLNSPWGIAMRNNRIVIGNFGDGRLNVYSMAGAFVGQMHTNGRPIEIPGLWAIGFSPDQTLLYFTSGPGDEDHGLFGYMKRNR